MVDAFYAVISIFDLIKVRVLPNIIDLSVIVYV